LFVGCSDEDDVVRTSFRVDWDQLPSDVRARVERLVGGRVVEAVNQTGGYSPSLAARCRLDDGHRVFVKAGADVEGMNPTVPRMLRNEAKLCAHWPDGFPAPRLLGSHDDGTWVLVVFEDVEGRTPAQPWSDVELTRVVAMLDDLPTPPNLPLPRAAERFAFTFGGFAAMTEPPADEWTVANLDRLVEMESAWPDAVAGDELIHNDVRDDNLLLADDGRTLLVDWAHAGIGARWLDLVFLAPSVELAGGPACEDLIARSRRAQRAAAEELTTAVVALLGYFTRVASLPPPPGVPAVRAFQEAQRAVTQRWLRQRLPELG
jgi:aminoglycoside phosphotransferase (APT) family kinase protein